eukprot:gene7543-9040_t
MTTEAPKIFWAKMPGFAPWPARYCSKLETIDLRRRAMPKGGQVAAVFLERKMKRGWVSEANTEEFMLDQIISPNGGGLFNQKFFDSNANYRLSVMEAVRITYSQVNNDPNMSRDEAAAAAGIYQQITSLIHKHEPGFPLKMRESKNAPPTAIEICELCHGTIYSGELRSCSVTEDVLEDREAKHCAGEGRIHFHCLQPHEDKIIADERWYCTVCCDNYGWQPNVILPANDTLLPFFGTVDRFLPPSIGQPDDQLYHITYDDGDGEDFTQQELQAGMDLYDYFKGPQLNRPFRTEMFMATYGVNPDYNHDHANNPGTKKRKGSKYATKGRAWTQQHSSVGVRVCKYFVGEMAAPTLHANSVREKGRNRHARSVEEEQENMEVEIKTELDTSGEPAEPTLVSAEETAAVVAEEAPSRPPPLFHIFVSSSAENNVVTSIADAAPTAASSAKETNAQDKTRVSAAMPTAALSAQRASKRAAIVLDQPPRKLQDTEDQKAKLRQLNMEKQAAAKRQLQSTSGSSTNNGKATVESAPSFSVIKKKKTGIVEDTESVVSHPRGDNSNSRAASNSNSRSWPSSSKADSNDNYGRRDGRDSGNSGSNSRTSYSRYEAPSQGHSTTLYDTRRPASSHTASTSSASAVTSVNTARIAETLSLAPPETSNNTANIKVVHFIDQCMAIMKRHQQHMISARQRVLQAYTPVGSEFSNNLVESLAADIVQIIGPSAQAEILTVEVPARGSVAPPVKIDAAESKEAEC